MRNPCRRRQRAASRSPRSPSSLCNSARTTAFTTVPLHDVFARVRHPRPTLADAETLFDLTPFAAHGPGEPRRFEEPFLRSDRLARFFRPRDHVGRIRRIPLLARTQVVLQRLAAGQYRDGADKDRGEPEDPT